MASYKGPFPNADRVVVRNSALHGRGLFARKDIPVGGTVIEYVGERISKEESERRGLHLMELAKEDGGAAVFIFTLNDEHDLDGDVDGNLARLINHSCDPNCEAQQDEEDRVWIVATKDIERGDELCFNYGFDIECWEDHPCRCGAKTCVGYIVAEDYWVELAERIAASEAGEEGEGLGEWGLEDEEE